MELRGTHALLVVLLYIPLSLQGAKQYLPSAILCLLLSLPLSLSRLYLDSILLRSILDIAQIDRPGVMPGLLTQLEVNSTITP